MKKSLRLKALLVLLVGLFLSIGAFAQQIAVKGHVKDTTGEPVIGANVLVKGTTNGTITDFDGNFMLNVPKDAILSVSFVGYKTAEVKAAPTVMITLEDDSQVLDAVVVIGYGSVKKNDMTGSVTAIKPDKLNKGLITNAQDMMTGKIAGVSVVSKGGAPGAGATIRIRGGSSLTAENDPLIVIDGLAMDNKGVKGLSNPLSMVNPNDIESFTVLKDASATAIYGSRASNGVIIITTKKGQAGARPTISYDGNLSVSNVKSTVDVMDGNQFRSFIKDIWGEDSEAYSKLGNANTDWQKEIFRAAVSTDHNLTISGGLKNMPYRVSFGYTNQNGILKTSKFERYTASVSLAPSFFQDHLKVNANLKGMIAKNRYADGNAVGSAVSFDPTQSVRSDDPYHQYYFDGFFQWNTDASSLNDDTWKRTFNGNAPGNPVALLEEKNDRAISKSLIGNLELDYKFHFLPDLHAHVNGGMDLSTGKQYTDVSPYSSTNNYYGSYGWEEKDKYNLSLNAYLQYSKDFTDKHRFDVMAGYEWQHFHDTSDQEYWGLYPLSNNVVENRGQRYNNTASGSATESYLVSFFGRVNYTLLDRYLFTATVRQDGSSRFHKDNRWGLFPSFALGWKLKEEAFLKDVDVLSDLKLRLGYGITGQQNINSGDYPYLAVYETNKDGAYYPILGEGITYRPNAYNPDLKWEKTTTYNVGVDFGFLNNRINGSVDYYYRKTTDLLNSVFVSAGTNFKNKVLSNVGSLENSGVEFSINSKPVVTTDWTWDLGFNITYNKNEITKLTTGDSENYYVAAGDNIGGGRDMKAMAHAVGHPASSFYVYQQVYDENGRPIENEFVDRNGDGTINGDDRYFYKKPTADVLMGLTSRLSYKSWDFSFSLRASLNNYVYNSVEAGGSDCNPTSIYSFGALNNRPLMGVANNIQSKNDNTLLSDYFVQNASFMKCDNITLGYSFKKLFGAPIGGRVYAAVQNVFTISKYKGLDPEVENGLDNNIYPRPLTTLIGLSLNF
ncbi:SusC/RagA family TonB-linked outer membrane protein [Bacteroides congonensis]|jgi:TonB-linked SusC/RagA family outer membrane protein|uniref:SusC/RagA family TonB-linked outer membrane protein n=1 Tax=Bacteroides congonensis TaxID=1871006 RepID=UPI00033A62C5|nr:TonB-dependent receptor [Bacteroides congonensis]CDA82400.1 outer membrane receptor proteins mostly Fe transport [Bacteroides sp. CAG:754]